MVNENIIKNIASEVTRNCQAQNVIVETAFVVHLVELLLINPKYGKLFAKTLNRNNLEFFVNECVAMLIRGEGTLNTLKMQFIILKNYDKIEVLIEKHEDKIDHCLVPLLNEILDCDPEPDNSEAVYQKLFRKISIYNILASGLGNPSAIMTLKEAIAALESVFLTEDLKIFVSLPRREKAAQLNALMEVTAGVRLFNRDCNKGGYAIPDLPFDLVDAGKASIATLSNSLIGVMQRVNMLTTAVEGLVIIQDETGNVEVYLSPSMEITESDYNQICGLLVFNRQYEVFIRKMLTDVSSLVEMSQQLVERFKGVLEELHKAVKYKDAVPVDTVFPLFVKVWRVWREMQNIMYLVSTINRLMGIMSGLQEQMRIPYSVLERMLKGKKVFTDEDRVNVGCSMQERLSLGSLKNYICYDASSEFSTIAMKERCVQYLGFCAICLIAGALVPSNLKLGLIRHKGRRYGFCSVGMAARFSKDPERYINEALEYARNHPDVIHLLELMEDVDRVKDIDVLVEKFVPKLRVSERGIQTEVHPIEEHIDREYHWDLWEWKRRACKWADIVNCRTHSTQTKYSHLRSEIHCQTVSPRDKCQQTMKDAGVMTSMCRYYMWGLRGNYEDRQHSIDLVEANEPQKMEVPELVSCKESCYNPKLAYEQDMVVPSSLNYTVVVTSAGEYSEVYSNNTSGTSSFVPIKKNVE